MTPDTSANAVSGTTWALAMRRLPAEEQEAMLRAAQALLRHPEAVSAPLESELHVLAEELLAARRGPTAPDSSRSSPA